MIKQNRNCVFWIFTELQKSLVDQQAVIKAQEEDEDEFSKLSTRCLDIIFEKAILEQKIEDLQTQLRHVSQFEPPKDSSDEGGAGDTLTPGFPSHMRNMSGALMINYHSGKQELELNQQTLEIMKTSQHELQNFCEDNEHEQPLLVPHLASKGDGSNDVSRISQHELEKLSKENWVSLILHNM